MPSGRGQLVMRGVRPAPHSERLRCWPTHSFWNGLRGRHAKQSIPNMYDPPSRREQGAIPRRPLDGLWRPNGCEGSSSASGIFFLFFFFQICDFLKADLRERSITSTEPATFRCAGRRPATWVRRTGQGCLGYFSVALLTCKRHHHHHH